MNPPTHMTCISCPVGCRLTVKKNETADAEIAVSGNLCPRGAAYAKSEITNPVRMVTSTVRKKGGGTLSVKTSAPVPKSEIFNVLSRLKGIEISPPVGIGDVIVKDVIGGINIIATSRT